MSILNQMLQSPSIFVLFLYLIISFLIIRFSSHAYSRVFTPEIKYAPVRELRFVNQVWFIVYSYSNINYIYTEYSSVIWKK